jgi:hypothetical protein
VLQPNGSRTSGRRRSTSRGVVPGLDSQATPRAGLDVRDRHGGEIRSSPLALTRGSYPLGKRRAVECPGAADAVSRVADTGATLRP